jgi:hypothetical protein
MQPLSRHTAVTLVFTIVGVAALASAQDITISPPAPVPNAEGTATVTFSRATTTASLSLDYETVDVTAQSTGTGARTLKAMDIGSTAVSAAQDVETYWWDGKNYAVVASWTGNVNVYVDTGASFAHVNTIAAVTPVDVEPFVWKNKLYMAVCNNRNPNPTGSSAGHVDSVVYRWNSATKQFVDMQHIPTNFCRDMHFFEMQFGGAPALGLAVANHRSFTTDLVTYSTNSEVWVFDDDLSRFELLQTIPTSGATDIASFTSSSGDTHLMFANSVEEESVFGIVEIPRNYRLNSPVYVFDTTESQFLLQTNVETVGVADLEIFHTPSSDAVMLAVANRVDLENGEENYAQQVVVYIWTEQIKAFLEVTSINTLASSALSAFHLDDTLFLAVGGEQSNDGAAETTTTIYRYSEAVDAFATARSFSAGTTRSLATIQKGSRTVLLSATEQLGGPFVANPSNLATTQGSMTAHRLFQTAPGMDYVATSSTLIFLPGIASLSVQVFIVAPTALEALEVF